MRVTTSNSQDYGEYVSRVTFKPSWSTHDGLGFIDLGRYAFKELRNQHNLSCWSFDDPNGEALRYSIRSNTPMTCKQGEALAAEAQENIHYMMDAAYAAYVITKFAAERNQNVR